MTEIQFDLRKGKAADTKGIKVEKLKELDSETEELIRALHQTLQQTRQMPRP